MTVSFKGWKERVATFEAASDLEAGSVVKVSEMCIRDRYLEKRIP